MGARFDQKVVVVTGAAGGIGLAAARAFAGEGAMVVLADLAADKVEEKAQEIRELGGTAAGVCVDVASYESCQEMVAFAVETFGGLHVAFNNAGVPAVPSPEFEDCSVEDWNRVMGVNSNGVFYSMKAEVPAMRQSGGTAIINTASVSSFVATPGMPAYTSSKHAVAGLTKSAALELIRHGIRVNAVCPGVVDTPMMANSFPSPEVRAAIEAQSPIGRFAQAQEIADTVLFLASDQASYLVGSLVRADGGLSLP